MVIVLCNMATAADKNKINIAVRVDQKLADELDQAILQAKVDEKLPPNASRAEVLRKLIRRGIENEDLLSEIEY